MNPLKFFQRCKHENLRCVHGDEINQTGRMFRRPEIARAACTDCGRYVYDKGLPEYCTTTGEPHWNMSSKEQMRLRRY